MTITTCVGCSLLRHKRVTACPMRCCAHTQGLYLLCGGRRGRIWHTLLKDDERTVATMARLPALAERDDRFLVECQQYLDDTPAEQAALPRLLAAARRAGMRCLATHDVHVIA